MTAVPVQPDAAAVAAGLAAVLLRPKSSVQQQADALSRVCSLSDSQYGLAVRRELAARGVVDVVARLITCASSAEVLRCKAANALGSLAMEPTIAAQILPAEGRQGWVSVTPGGSIPTPEQLLAALRAMLETSNTYARADACMCLGWLTKSCTTSWVERVAAEVTDRVVHLLAIEAPYMNSERSANLVTFALVLLHNFATRARDGAAQSLLSMPTLVDTLLSVALQAEQPDLLIICDTLHITSQLAGGQAALLEAKAVGILGKLQRTHPELVQVLRAVIAAIVTPGR